MAVLTVPPTTIPAGSRLWGPAAVALAWTKAEIVVDITALPLGETFSATAEYSLDGGAHWILLGVAGPLTQGPYTDLGSPRVTHPTMPTAAAFWSLSPVANAGLVRLTTQASVAFVCAGGTVTLS